jgi:hypothetical protein
VHVELVGLVDQSHHQLRLSGMDQQRQRPGLFDFLDDPVLVPDQARYGRSSAGYQPATRAGLPALRTKISPQKVFRAEMHVLRPYIPA